MRQASPEKKNFQKQLRANSTDAERLLWRYLRAGRLQGFRFRRQHRFGPYIVDFYCPQKQLIIELDGGQHALRPESDQRRTVYLQSRKLEVMRFWNNEVLRNIETVLDVIWTELVSRRGLSTERFNRGRTLSPTLPLKQGEGGREEKS